jgi:hypothetical protein
MKVLPENEQASTEQFHSFIATLMNSYGDLKNKIPKKIQELVKNPQRLKNEWLLFVANAGMPDDSHIFDCTKPLFTPSAKGNHSLKIHRYMNQEVMKWNPENLYLESLGSVLNGRHFRTHIRHKGFITANDLFDIAAHLNELSNSVTFFANDCMLHSLCADFSYLIPESWSEDIIMSLGTLYKYTTGDKYFTSINQDDKGKWEYYMREMNKIYPGSTFNIWNKHKMMDLLDIKIIKYKL